MPWIINMELPSQASFPLSNRYYDHFHSSSCQGSQTDKITEENLVSIAKNKGPSIRVKMHQTFFLILATISLISAEWM